MTVVTPKFGMGASVLRLEDQAFITGKGRYTDDIAPEGLLHGYVLRSPVAKAQLHDRLDSRPRRAAPGVHLVLTGEDLAASRRAASPASCRSSRTAPRRRPATFRSCAATASTMSATPSPSSSPTPARWRRTPPN